MAAREFFVDEPEQFVTPTPPPLSADPCRAAQRGEHCGPGKGRRTKGGGEKVSHKGWPAVTGVLWMVLDHRNHDFTGGPLNDELLGFDGDDRLVGGAGHDILWGNSHPKPNSPTQHDVLIGGAGNDWIYSSHGHNVMTGGTGSDHIWAHFGRGTVDCGPGRDFVNVRRRGSRYKLRNCERIRH